MTQNGKEPARGLGTDADLVPRTPKPAQNRTAGATGGSANDWAGLSEQTQARLGTHLRAMYDTVLNQPVPDRFRDLIAKLDDRNTDEP